MGMPNPLLMLGDIGCVDPPVAAVPAHPAVQVQDWHVPAEPFQQARHSQRKFPLMLKRRRLAPVRQPAISPDRVLCDGVVVRRGADQGLAWADAQRLEQATVRGCRRVQVGRRFGEQLVKGLTDQLDDLVEMIHCLRIPLVKHAVCTHHLCRGARSPGTSSARSRETAHRALRGRNHPHRHASNCGLTRALRTPASPADCAVLARSHPPGAALRGPIPRTNHGLTIKRPDRHTGDQASDLQLLGSGGRI
jgi:hypothetical protein